MKKNRYLLLALTAPLLVGLASCSTITHKMKHDTFVKSEAKTGLEYLYEVTYQDYSWDDVTTWMNSDKNVNENQGGFGCSSVHNGNFYGRSFDFCYTDMCEFLVRTPKTRDRYASLGVAIADCNLNDEKVKKINSGTGSEKEKLNEKMIPFTLVDGINEKGVVCNTNVVPAKDLTPHPGEEKYFTHSTNPGKQDLFYQFMPRFILDNASSAKQAVELLKNRNLTAINKKGEQCDYFGVSHMGYELHCMIADKNDTFIIEMVNDRMSVLSGGEIMTNYYFTKTTESGAGFERYNILLNEFEMGNSLEGMKKLIQEVQYSPCYDTRGCEITKAPIWPSEFAGVDVCPTVEGGVKLTFFNAEDWFQTYWDEDPNIKLGIDKAYQKIRNGERDKKTGGDVPWISTHAEVYDIENRTLHLVTQEKTDGGEGHFDGDYAFRAFKL